MIRIPGGALGIAGGRVSVMPYSLGRSLGERTPREAGLPHQREMQVHTFRARAVLGIVGCHARWPGASTDRWVAPVFAFAAGLGVSGAEARGHRFGQLDALRAFAVLGVVACHTFDEQRQSWAQYGGYGVQLFFVISGFLITGILMDARRDADALALPMTGVFRSFYARRALRIIPIYYVTLAIGTFIGVQGMREELGWNVLYLSNWRIALDGHWGGAPHIWSLAVEEQFYLLWPFVVLLAPRRLLPWAIGSMILVALVTRTALTAGTDMWSDGTGIVTPAALDALGLGALLAMLWRASSNVDRIVAWIGALAAVVFAAGLVVGHVSALSDGTAVTSHLVALAVRLDRPPDHAGCAWSPRSVAHVAIVGVPGDRQLRHLPVSPLCGPGRRVRRARGRHQPPDSRPWSRSVSPRGSRLYRRGVVVVDSV